MNRRPRNKTQIKQIGLIMAAAWIGMVGTACRSEKKPEIPPEDVSQEATSGTAERIESKLVPSTTDVIARLRATIDTSPDNFGERIKARRGLIYQLSRIGETGSAMLEFEAFVEDVEQHEGEAKARMAARYLAQLLFARNHPLASAIYENMIGRWPETKSTPEYLYKLGTSHDREEHYPEAIVAYQRLIEEHDDSVFAPRGWQGIAAAQRSLEDWDAALATLDVIITKYKDRDHASRATINKGEVLTAMGRPEEAMAIYAAFLSENRPGKYHLEAQEKLDQLNEDSGKTPVNLSARSDMDSNSNRNSTN